MSIKSEVDLINTEIFNQYKRQFASEVKELDQKEKELTEIHITIHSGKLANIPSINTSSLTNPYCIERSKNKKTICSKCYSNTLSSIRKQLEAKLIKNSKVLSKIIPYEKLPRFNSLIVRMSSFGDLVNYNHLINLTKIAVKNPKTTFALWTKRTDLIKQYYKGGNFPSNMVIIYSNPLLDMPMKLIPRGFDKVFQVFSKQYITETNRTINCGAKNCFGCQTCYNFDGPYIISEVLK